MSAEDHPTAAEWASRSAWFEATLAAARGDGAVEVGEQATALLIELETVFCAGAWVATIILAAAIIEAHLREAMPEAPQYLNARDLFIEAGLPEDFDWLRRHRNRLVHFAAEPYLTVDMHWFEREALEADARRAVELTADAVFRYTPRQGV